MEVVSLFNGMSCGMLALERLGIVPDSYISSEIDKYANKVSSDNFPQIKQVGDIRILNGNYLPSTHLLIAGSPCQGFSFAGKGLSFNDHRSALFFEFVRLLNQLRPKYFLLENVIMKKEYSDAISNILGVRPIRINSELVSAQRRDRLYWTNIPNVTQPDDKKIFLKDIIEDGFTDRDKSYCIDANYFKGTNLEQYLKKKRRQIIFNYSSSGRGNGIIEDRFYESEKAHTLTAVGYSKRSFTGVYSKEGIRKLTVLECKRLQTVRDDFKMNVSNSQAYKMLGNGWTVDVIAHILKGAI